MMMVEQILDQQEPLVEVRDLHISFGKQPVLRNINLKIPAGQTVVVLGESGCGKTVLIKSMIGLVNPTRGQVFFDSQDLSRLNERRLSHQRLRCLLYTSPSPRD